MLMSFFLSVSITRLVLELSPKSRTSIGEHSVTFMVSFFFLLVKVWCILLVVSLLVYSMVHSDFGFATQIPSLFHPLRQRIVWMRLLRMSLLLRNPALTSLRIERFIVLLLTPMTFSISIEESLQIPIGTSVLISTP